VETYIRSGAYGRARRSHTPGTTPPASSKAVGGGVRGVAAGDRVLHLETVTGRLRGALRCAALPRVHPLPASVSYAQGPRSAYRTHRLARPLQRVRAVPGETVLVHGASGGVGSLPVQIARPRAARLRHGGDREGIALVLRERAHPSSTTVRRVHGSGGGGDRGPGVRRHPGNARNPEPAAGSQGPRDGGRVVVIGNRGTVEIDPRIRWRATPRRRMSLFNMRMPIGPSSMPPSSRGSNGTLRPFIGASCRCPRRREPCGRDVARRQRKDRSSFLTGAERKGTAWKRETGRRSFRLVVDIEQFEVRIGEKGWHTYQIVRTRAASASSAARRRDGHADTAAAAGGGRHPPRDPGGQASPGRGSSGVRQQGDGRGDGALRP